MEEQLNLEKKKYVDFVEQHKVTIQDMMVRHKRDIESYIENYTKQIEGLRGEKKRI